MMANKYQAVFTKINFMHVQNIKILMFSLATQQEEWATTKVVLINRSLSIKEKRKETND